MKANTFTEQHISFHCTPMYHAVTCANHWLKMNGPRLKEMKIIPPIRNVSNLILRNLISCV